MEREAGYYWTQIDANTNPFIMYWSLEKNKWYELTPPHKTYKDSDLFKTGKNKIEPDFDK